MSGFLSDVGKAVSDGVDAAAEAVSDGVNAAAEAVSDGVNAAAEVVSDGVNAAAEAVTDGVDTAGRAVSRGLGAVNNACNKANDSMEAITEMVVSSPDILADMIADSIVGQYWSDLWDLNVDSVNAIEGILEDTAEELANDEDVPGFIRDYMNGFIGADVPCNFFGMLGAGCRGVEEMLSGVYKGTSGVLGHPCQTEENIADALIIAGEATKYFIEDPKKATENAISSVSGWWNDKNTYEKIRTVVEAYIIYRMIASSGSKGETVTLESEAAGVTEEAAKAGEVAEDAAKAGEVAEEAAKAGEVAEEAAKAGEVAGEVAEEAAKAGEAGAEVAEDAAKAGGKGKVKIESAGKSGGLSNNPLSFLQRALKNQGLNTTPNRLKETWIDGDYKYTVRIHEGNTKYTNSSSIYRVSRQSTILDANGQGTGLEYLGTDGNWYHKSVLEEFFKGGTPNPNFNQKAARITHIAINGGN